MPRTDYRAGIGDIPSHLPAACRTVTALLSLAQVVASIDVFSSLAEVAVRYGYVRPILNDGNEINIKGGRHPIVERNLSGNSFVANDTYLSNDSAQIIVLTGPNMAGKSTYLKQVALITLMAQIGSFVPAKEATIGITDRIFTRIGAREDLASGQSTFMVEMVETANILNNATSKSLIILDEIGRGTSTYDGLSIARAVTEYIHNKVGAKTIFATHYHEMVEVANYLPRVRISMWLSPKKKARSSSCARCVPAGWTRATASTWRSWPGCRARSCTVPRRCWTSSRGRMCRIRRSECPIGRYLLSSYRCSDRNQRLEEALNKLDVDSLTPLEALTHLYELKKKVSGT